MSHAGLGWVISVVLCASILVAPSAAAGTPAARPASATNQEGVRADFNGDGYGDLAVASTNDLGDEDALGEPVVFILYGSSRGLTGGARQAWTANDLAGPDDGTSTFGAALAAGNFDGDGYTDLAIGEPEAFTDDLTEFGRVHVLYGSGQGLDGARRQTWSQDTPGVPGGAESFDSFGWSLAAANLGAGSEDDLAVGVPGENRYSGAVNVLFGSAGGLTSAGSQFLTQNSVGILGRADRGDDFGLSLAAGQFGPGQYAALAIGVPYEDVGRVSDAGAVNVVRGSKGGLTARGNQLWTQDSRGIAGRSGRSDAFGHALAAGAFNGGDFDGLAVGAPSEYDRPNGGSVNVIYGSRSGLGAAGNQLWTQDTEGVAGRAESGDRFGASVAAADFGRRLNGRASADLAVGAPGEDRGETYGTGAVHIFYGGSDGLSARYSERLSQGTPGIAGTSGPDDASFGTTLAAADFGRNRDGGAPADLAIGSPWDDEATVGEVPSRGVVNVIYGSADGLTAAGDQIWSGPELRQSSRQAPFGLTLSAG